MARIKDSAFWAKFGKKPAKRDERNLKFGPLLVSVPKLPQSFDFDEKYIAVSTPMFGNDEHGDCVIAGRAHQTMRFEYVELRKLLKITDAEVLRQWRKENGHTEDGLVVLDSLKQWRKTGWKAGGRTLKIKAFAELNRKKHDELRRAIVMQIGVGLGFTLPFNALPLFQAGKAWDVGKGSGAKPDPDGGHYVYCPGYTKDGPVCVTWGRKQQLTWRFFDRYCDEAYAMVDARDAKRRKAGSLGGKLDYQLLDQELKVAIAK
jgi:hypothetical protein